MGKPPESSPTAAAAIKAVGAIKIAARPSPATFKKALNRLATDTNFRETAIKDPARLTNTFDLSLKELHALRQAAVLTGANMSQINRVRASQIATRGDVAADDINVSCCCCCCCGETGVILAHG